MPEGDALDRLVCSCKQLGAIAVLQFRLTPSTNSLAWGKLASLTPRLLATPAYALSLVLGLAFFVACLLLALAHDCHTRYLDMGYHRLPMVIRPGVFDCRKEFAMLVRHHSRP